MKSHFICSNRLEFVEIIVESLFELSEFAQCPFLLHFDFPNSKLRTLFLRRNYTSWMIVNLKHQSYNIL